MSRSRASETQAMISRDFRAPLASFAGARTLGSTFRRSRDMECCRAGSFHFGWPLPSPQWLAKVVSILVLAALHSSIKCRISWLSDRKPCDSKFG